MIFYSVFYLLKAKTTKTPINCSQNITTAFLKSVLETYHSLKPQYPKHLNLTSTVFSKYLKLLPLVKIELQGVLPK